MTDSGNSHVIRVLYVEDNEFDRELVAQVLERDGFALEIVTADNEADFRSSLERPDFDLILSDFTLPQFSGDHALTLARELRPEIPFLFFSGTIGEERAVASLRAGAVDYVLKQNLDRLPSAIRRALREASQKAENKQASLRLAELAQRMHLLLESSGEGIYGTDRQGRCTFLNRSGAHLLGWTAQEVLGKNMHALVRHHKHDGTPYQEEDCSIFHATTAGENCRLDSEVFWRKDGSSFLVEYSCHPIFEGGISTGSVVTFSNISERKRAERALVLFRALIDRTNDAIEVVDPETGRFLDVNEVACQSHGYTREEFLNLKVSDIEEAHGFSSPHLWRQNVAELKLRGFRLVKAIHRRKDGSTFPVEVNANYVRLDRDYIVAVVRDATERENAERALRESEQRFRQVTESIDEVFWLKDVATNEMIYVSPAFERIWGWPCESLYRAPDSWTDNVHPEDRDRVRNALLLLRTSGSYDVQYRIVRQDGSKRWIHDRAFPIKDAQGKVYRFAGVAEDITRHRELEEQFRQAQKMDAIGRLAGGMAHDFNNILGAIMGYTELARSTVVDKPETIDCLDQVSRASGRAAALVKRILLFSRQHEQERKPMQLEKVIQEAINLLRASVPSSVEFQTRFEAVPQVFADASSVHQVVMNLATNAWHAMKGKQGILKVELAAVEIDSEFAANHPDLRPGCYARLLVGDNGCGMSPQTLERIFDPFFTTKGAGEGTGLGLSIVHGIMKSHEGTITVSSVLGEGTTFQLYFPETKLRGNEVRIQDSPLARGKNQKILLVEDEISLAALGKRILEQLGYSVTSMESPTEAIKYFRTHFQEVDLVITDLTMPVMDGATLAGAMLQIRSDIPIILTTGYSGVMTSSSASELGFREILIKPTSMRSLSEAVARALSKNSQN